MDAGNEPPNGVRTPPGPRFLRLDQVAEDLSISTAQTYALVRSGDLRAIKVGGRGQWRVERSVLEGFIARLYTETAEFVRDHPFGVAVNLESDAGPDQPADWTV